MCFRVTSPSSNFKESKLHVRSVGIRKKKKRDKEGAYTRLHTCLSVVLDLITHGDHVKKNNK